MDFKLAPITMTFSLLPKSMPFNIVVYSPVVAKAIWDAMTKAEHTAHTMRP